MDNKPVNSFGTFLETVTAGAPWVCPRCGRVWGPSVTACVPCNQKIDQDKKGQ